jgi:hypothetical protein
MSNHNIKKKKTLKQMALPKKFNETINLKNRIGSLNDLIFYTVKYDYVLTGKKVEEFDTDTEVTGIKEFSALDDEQANAKIQNWFNVLIKNGVLESYDIKSTEVRSLYETLEDKKILDVLTHNNPQ